MKTELAPGATEKKAEKKPLPRMGETAILQGSMPSSAAAAGQVGAGDFGGRSLRMPQPVQAKMEHAFGTDFSSVRMVESPGVGAVGAQAMAQGNTVGFAPGKFSPNTQSGQELIGHELSHVVSQAKGEVKAPQGKGLSLVADQSLESKADAQGIKAARGEHVGGGMSVLPLSGGQGAVQGKFGWKPQSRQQTGPQTETTQQAPTQTGQSSGPTNFRQVSPGETMSTILSYDKKNIFNPQIQQMIINDYIRFGNDAMKKTQTAHPELQGEALRVALFQSFRSNAPEIMNFTALVNAMASSLGDSATMRMDLTGGVSAKGMADNTYIGMMDVSRSVMNNARLGAVLAQTRRMFDGIDYFQDNPQAITDLTTNNLLLRGIVPSITTMMTQEPDGAKKENLTAMSKFFQRIGNGTVQKRNMGVESSAYDYLQENLDMQDPMQPLKMAVGTMMNAGTGDALEDETWEAMRLAQAPGATDEMRRSAYNVITNAQFAAMTPEQQAAGKEYIKDSRRINGVLRGVMPEDTKTRGQITALNEIMTAAKTDVRTYRSVGDNSFATILQQLGLQGAKDTNGVIDRTYIAQNKGGVIGKVFTDQGFGSTTTEDAFAIKWGKGLPGRESKGAQARAYESMIPKETLETSQYGEVIYNPNTPVAIRQKYIELAARDFLTKEQYDEVQDRFAASKMGYHVLQINVPKDAMVAFIDRTSSTVDFEGVGHSLQQFEVLLSAGAQFQVTGIESLVEESGDEVANGYRLIMNMLVEEEA